MESSKPVDNAAHMAKLKAGYSNSKWFSGPNNQPTFKVEEGIDPEAAKGIGAATTTPKMTIESPWFNRR